jgi:hypothetical protein
MFHERLLNWATDLGAERILARLPLEDQDNLRPAVREGVREALLYYASELRDLRRRQFPMEQNGHGRGA